jgi:benzoyl-CoA-dihydrodiol lyase
VDPSSPIRFELEPFTHRHWEVAIDGAVATVTMAVDPAGGLGDDYQLKLNSYDLGVDIELYDIVQRLRFEHPSVRAVVVTGGLDKVFCAGANIQMLAGASHHHKVNFCKFTNETRNAIEDATAHSGQTWLAAINGTAAGGGYELALACDEIILVDDRSSSVSLPEVPMLGVLPGTGGLTRLVDKRGVRRDLADVFATRPEGVRGQQAVEWRLVDAVAPRSGFNAVVEERSRARAEASDRPASQQGIELGSLERDVTADGLRYPHLAVSLDRALATAEFTISVPDRAPPAGAGELVDVGSGFWLLALARQLDDAVLHLRFNEPAIGTWVFWTTGDPATVLAADEALRTLADHWLAREIRLFWKRTLKRLDLSARTLVALVEPGSCFAGTLFELVLAADRSFMLEGAFEDRDDTAPPASLVLTDANTAWYPMANGLSRLATRFHGQPDALAAVEEILGKELSAADAARLGLVTSTPDDIDWDDEVRLFLEERASFSPDALVGMEANLRFVGPETMETKIFGRLSAWQNWIFQRPNAAGEEGALRRYGSGSRPTFDPRRV